MERLIDKAADELSKAIPKDAAKQVIANGVVNNLLTAGPLIFKVISRLAEANRESRPNKPDDSSHPAG
jgi:hypothetical protein